MVTTFTLLAASLLVSADPAEAAKAEMKKMEGIWKFEKLVQNGNEPVDSDDLAKMSLIVKGENRTVKDGDEVKTEATYKIDPAGKPKQIDITVTSGNLKGQTLLGIYELDGDIFKVCLGLDGKTRPKDFTSEADSGVVLQVFKKEKK